MPLSLFPKTYEYCWEWVLEAPPEALWPLVADTNRFNRDASLPVVTDALTRDASLTRAMSFVHLGIRVSWREEPFEWVANRYFSIVRHFTEGPLREARGRVTLEPGPGGKGTRIRYQAWLQPANPLGHLAIPVQIGLLTRQKTAQLVRHYDRLARLDESARLHGAPNAGTFPPGGLERLDAMARELAENTGSAWVKNLRAIIREGDDFAVRRLRPYLLADTWGAPRREVLKLCLEATRAGLLDLGWNLLCPLCRGTRAPKAQLREVSANAHCPSCNIDFSVDFDRSVEVTFRPNPAIRAVPELEYCTGSPQRTAHVWVQQIVEPGMDKTLTVSLPPGRYRIRDEGNAPGIELTVQPGQAGQKRAAIWNQGWQLLQQGPEAAWDTETMLRIENPGTARHLFILETLDWDEQAATAAEVTSLQTFRDLFSSEALRPEEQVSVGRLTLVFTDLKDSTALYRQIGDAPAFGSVMSHFDVLRKCIVAEDGAIVKTMGDAVMAVFTRPASAVRSMLKAQAILAQTPIHQQVFHLKVGIHQGPCIAVNLNERLDYFGSTVNIAARLQGLSEGDDMVISPEVFSDPDVHALLAGERLDTETLECTLKGFGEQRFNLIRLKHSLAGMAATSPAPTARPQASPGPGNSGQ